jgi:hypothetical protein
VWLADSRSWFGEMTLPRGGKLPKLRRKIQPS